MALQLVDELADEPRHLSPEPDGEPPQRRRVSKVLIGIGLVLALVTVAAVLWFVLGRDEAEQLSNDQALNDFRSSGAASSEPAGRPTPGVYAAMASGTESIGVPGFDEELGPNAPVTVTHGADGCYTYLADFNSHHSRSWTFCPTGTATFSLTKLTSRTARKAPGFDIATLTTYTCERPLDFLWQGASVGDTRTGACRGTTDADPAITEDAGRIEVLDLGTIAVGGTSVDVVHLRSTDTFAAAQNGTEVDEWWIDATTGLPMRIVVDASLAGGATDYGETIDLALSTVTPAT